MRFTSLRITCMGAALVVAACASDPVPPPPPYVTRLPSYPITPPPSEYVRESLGIVGVTSADSAPASEVSRPVKEAKVGGAAAAGAGQGAGAVLRGVASGGDPRGLALYIVLLPVLIPAGAIVGASVGAARESVEASTNTIPADVANEMEATLRQVLAARRPQDDLRRRLVARAVLLKQDVEDIGTATRDQAIGDTSLTAGKKVDSFLDVNVTNVGLVGRGGGDPELTLLIEASAQLVDASDRHLLWQQEHVVYTSASHTFSQWKENKAELLQSVFDNGLEALARQIGDKVFLESWSN